MTFSDAVSTCFKKYATFKGTASRSEYWWFYLFVILLYVAAIFVHDALGTLVLLATLMPLLSAGTRRLHDSDRSGWWQLISVVPLIGLFAHPILMAKETRPNRYQAVPVAT